MNNPDKVYLHMKRMGKVDNTVNGVVYSWTQLSDFHKETRWRGALPRQISGKEESACNAGDAGLIPQSGRSPGEAHGNPFQYSCQEKSIDKEAWKATVHGVTRVKRDRATENAHKETRTYEGDTNCSVLPLPSCFPHTTTSQEQSWLRKNWLRKDVGIWRLRQQSG